MSEFPKSPDQKVTYVEAVTIQLMLPGGIFFENGDMSDCIWKSSMLPGISPFSFLFKIYDF